MMELGLRCMSLGLGMWGLCGRGETGSNWGQLDLEGKDNLWWGMFLALGKRRLFTEVRTYDREVLEIEFL